MSAAPPISRSAAARRAATGTPTRWAVPRPSARSRAVFEAEAEGGRSEAEGGRRKAEVTDALPEAEAEAIRTLRAAQRGWRELTGIGAGRVGGA